MRSSPDPLRLSAPVEAALWMILASLIFAAGNALVRHTTASLHPFEVAFFRNLFSLLVMLPWVVTRGVRVMRTDRLGLYVTRAATGLMAMLCWFWGLSVMPLGDATALSFTTPLFATVGAALFLGEVVRARRWIAVAVGFAGVLVIVRPGPGSLSVAALVVLASCLFAAVSALQVRSLARSETSAAMVTYMVLFLTPMSLVPALFVWQWPDWPTLGWLALLGTILTFGHLAMTRAFALAEASALMPYDYVKLPLSALIAYLAFGEVMDASAWAGAGVIVASTLYIAHREAVVARSARTAGAAAAESPSKP
ncbi:DMT family transporter [Azospirillum halopraeferens]|uniref:DMT family transporter n=1 Tax=Azospirillum halopraeferens TaxID=34010 RepID=UPI00041F3C94|nr:DMT family transporter [Azospirillum halopraeferens]